MRKTGFSFKKHEWAVASVFLFWILTPLLQIGSLWNRAWPDVCELI